MTIRDGGHDLGCVFGLEAGATKKKRRRLEQRGATYRMLRGKQILVRDPAGGLHLCGGGLRRPDASVWSYAQGAREGSRQAVMIIEASV